MSNINLNTYFNKGTFVIPDYQRGYKWPVSNGNTKSSLIYFIDSLIEAYQNNLTEYFIEAVTVVEEDENIILVDGQQRTTSLFLLFIALKEYGLIQNKLIYDVREDSHNWLNNQICNDLIEIKDEDTQDIYYFKRGLDLLKEKIENIDSDQFLFFLKNNVKLLYNTIPKDKAVNTFIALNGLKAIMKAEELIKSDLLIKSSRTENIKLTGDIELEWKINEDRGRLARNWDKWLYWWNQEEVRSFFIIGNEHPLHYLLTTYLKLNSSEKNLEFSFEQFKEKFIKNSRDAKLHFEELRKLQKTFEDLYNTPYSYNFLGLILKTSKDREAALHYFLDKTIVSKLTLEEYAKWSLVRATHLEIINDTIEKIIDDEVNQNLELLVKKAKANYVINLLNEKYVYWNDKDEEFPDDRKQYAYDLLLLLNLIEDNRLNRKFDFSIWNNRSLEHIYPKSKRNKLDFEHANFREGSIHCIGNLVLLYGKDNSSFGAKEFSEKKNHYFNITEEFKSRNLLHTISIFSKSNWGAEEIIENKKNIITHLTNYYGI